MPSSFKLWQKIIGFISLYLILTEWIPICPVYGKLLVLGLPSHQFLHLHLFLSRIGRQFLAFLREFALLSQRHWKWYQDETIVYWEMWRILLAFSYFTYFLNYLCNLLPFWLIHCCSDYLDEAHSLLQISVFTFDGYHYWR